MRFATVPQREMLEFTPWRPRCYDKCRCKLPRNHMADKFDFDLVELATSPSGTVVPDAHPVPHSLRVLVSAGPDCIPDVVLKLRADGHTVLRSAHVWETLAIITTCAVDVLIVHLDDDYSPRAALIHPFEPRYKVIVVVGSHVDVATISKLRGRGVSAVFREPCEAWEIGRALA